MTEQTVTVKMIRPEELKLLRSLEQAVRAERHAALTFDSAMHYASDTGDERHVAAAHTAMRERQEAWHEIEALLVQLDALRKSWRTL